MQNRIFILLVVLLVNYASHRSLAQQTITAEQRNNHAVASEPLNHGEITSVRDTLVKADSIYVIHTVCAPICSSHVRVYNKEWQSIGVVKAPFKSAFPEAYIEDNRILWRDNDTFDYTPVQ